MKRVVQKIATLATLALLLMPTIQAADGLGR